MHHETLTVDFLGRRLDLLWELAVSGFLTLLTVGLYRSWMKTRLRRWYWGSVSIGGQPLEYVGRGSETFLGFVSAIAFLAIYVCVISVLLIYGSFRLAYAPGGGTIAAVMGLAPIAVFAQWRARAYIYARTRWRGIRFALVGSAWGYIWRSLLGGVATLVTLGFLLPWMAFEREKYMTDCTWFGTVRFNQGGDWTMLLPGIKILFPATLASVLVIVLGRTIDPAVLYGLWITIPTAFLGVGYFRTYSFRVLTNLKEAGGMRLAAVPPTWRIVWKISIGLAIATVFLIGATAAVTDGFQTGLASMGLTEMMEFYVDPSAQWQVLGIVFVLAVLIYMTWGLLSHFLVRVPLTRLLVNSLRVEHAEHLALVGQRRRVSPRGADGLFEALDMGMGL